MYLEVTAEIEEEQWYLYLKGSCPLWQLLGMYPERQEPKQLAAIPGRAHDIESYLRERGLTEIERRRV
ncbi:MAG: hypothetical protein COY38_04620 [Candidatus Aenigmarchaeota archaeon CG_4_10_14_0_8_um_filter_37_24]|nr:hypothetical protein [Candidatus Aenigmarchaeota archaeon]OIN88008.1 MAG: hypothetical protein AUJ50_01970 [Candidatus Aenigmarchaeota archaeon CG1_02_38_14]OIP34484.1 MAG: hypothetical protein AUK23_01600 [Deltaproteobacteria bacterium CG2_30_43_15]PIV69559.1 MAG: hypothetical protein COS07_00355 [Candidatus Aenigmarchaeota archaeon CG01_land_8_20_14_3_00_37_9]PIW41635.1 MAG: hypothetical protein COW21_00915 [Candidatus Aenigmarchaeota archaeon CG15_BIG_FIL_POST_REV_8_21_14_020_37_27]PIX50